MATTRKKRTVKRTAKKSTRKKTGRKSKGTSIVTRISAHAKRIRRSGEAWTSTIKRASRELKAAGKI